MRHKVFPKLKFRYTLFSDREHLQEWLSDPETIRLFGGVGNNSRETTKYVEGWIKVKKCRSSLTAVLEGIPCGIATLQLSTGFRRFAHTCDLSIIVNPKLRGQGIGRELLNQLILLAKEKFQIEVLGLHVQVGNPAIHLYKSCGFHEFGRQVRSIKNYKPGEPDVGRILMQKYL